MGRHRGEERRGAAAATDMGYIPRSRSTRRSVVDADPLRAHCRCWQAPHRSILARLRRAAGWGPARQPDGSRPKGEPMIYTVGELIAAFIARAGGSVKGKISTGTVPE